MEEKGLATCPFQTEVGSNHKDYFKYSLMLAAIYPFVVVITERNVVFIFRERE